MLHVLERRRKEGKKKGRKKERKEKRKEERKKKERKKEKKEKRKEGRKEGKKETKKERERRQGLRTKTCYKFSLKSFRSAQDILSMVKKIFPLINLTGIRTLSQDMLIYPIFVLGQISMYEYFRFWLRFGVFKS